MADESPHEEAATAAAIVSTAHLLLRGLIPAFVGCSIGSTSGGTKTSANNNNNDTGEKEQVRASAFQMTYRKDMIKFGPDGKSLLLVLRVLRAATALCSVSCIFPFVSSFNKKYPSSSLLWFGWLFLIIILSRTTHTHTQGDTRVK